MSVQRIRLPSVNDIFPKAENQLNPPQYIQSSPVQQYQNYTLSPGFVQQIQAQPQLAQPMPYHPQTGYIPANTTTIPTIPHGYQQITPSNSPISYITTAPNYNYHQPRHAGATHNISSQAGKFKIHKSSSTARQSNAWSASDDELLKYLKEVKNLGWREISMYFQNRTANGCQFRWRRIVALSKQQQQSYHGTIKRQSVTNESNSSSRSNSLESLLN